MIPNRASGGGPDSGPCDECPECGETIRGHWERDEDGWAYLVLDEHGCEPPEPECECRFTGDIADASGCPAHGPDARRLAVVPDLLAALKEIVAITDRKHDAWDRARAAIAKAEGNEHGGRR